MALRLHSLLTPKSSALLLRKALLEFVSLGIFRDVSRRVLSPAFFVFVILSSHGSALAGQANPFPMFQAAADQVVVCQSMSVRTASSLCGQGPFVVADMYALGQRLEVGRVATSFVLADMMQFLASRNSSDKQLVGDNMNMLVHVWGCCDGPIALLPPSSNEVPALRLGVTNDLCEQPVFQRFGKSFHTVESNTNSRKPRTEAL